MAERQQSPSESKRMSLDKIIDAMTADLKNPSENYVQFGATQSQTTTPSWGHYLTSNSRNYSASQSPPLSHQVHHPNSAPNILPVNSVSPPIYMQDVPRYNNNNNNNNNTNNIGDPIYFSPQAVNHLGINENNDLIGTIDVGGGNYINVIYGNGPVIVSDQCQVNNLSGYNGHQSVARDREYGLFNEPRVPVQHNSNCHQNTNGKQLIDNLVGNWVPNQSGTYSPFGSSPNVTPVQNSISVGAVEQKKEIEELLPKSSPHSHPKKQRIVAEVKPMRPSYSSVLTKSAPSPSLPLNTLTAKTQSDNGLKKTAGKNSKSKNKIGSLKRQNSSGSDDHGSPKIQVPKKSIDNKNHNNLSRRWVSLDNLEIHSESHEMDAFNRSDQFEKLSTFPKIRFLNAIGKRIDGWLGNSRFAFWRRIKANNKKLDREENTNWIPGRLETNISLPSTGEEAMK
ncbi:Protein of unknown function, partial [Cotesia congregata]